MKQLKNLITGLSTLTKILVILNSWYGMGNTFLGDVQILCSRFGNRVDTQID
jgi:hypothetical protein